MSGHDQDGKAAEERKKRQDPRVIDEWVQEYLASFAKGRDRPTLNSLNGALAKMIQETNKQLDHLGAKPEAPQPTAGVAHQHDYHQDALQSADHVVAGVDVLGPLAAVVLMQQMTEALQKIQFLSRTALGEQTIEGIKALSASIGEVWDQFKADAGQVIDDVKEQMIELVSLERTQDQVPVQEQETSVEIGGPRVDADIAEIRKRQDEQELLDEQEKARARQTAQVDERRDQLATKYEGSPEQERYLKQFEEAARQAAEELARQQQAERERLKEQQGRDR